VSANPNVVDVLAAVVPGRVQRLKLSREQRRTLRDRDGQIALNVLRHTLAARAAASTSDNERAFPLTESFVGGVARRIGTPVGQKRARALAHRLGEARVISYSGSYRQRYTRLGTGGGYRVRLYRLSTAVRGAAAPRLKHPVGREVNVKPIEVRRWWQHRLFGDYGGLPPPQLTSRQTRVWRSADERSRSRT
jgi:hypothetical protein